MSVFLAKHFTAVYDVYSKLCPHYAAVFLLTFHGVICYFANA